jgi:hypothetical protein
MKATPLQPDCLRICPLGLDERGLQTLQAFFERHLAGSCQLAPEAEAHAVLIDGDNYHAKKFLAEQRESCPNRPIILLTLTPEKAEIANGIVIQKPIKASQFATQLSTFSAQLFQPRPAMKFSAANNGVLEAKLKNTVTLATDNNAKLNRIDSTAAQLGSRERHYYVGSMPDVDLSQASERAKVFYDPNDFLQGHFMRAVALGQEKACVVRIIGKSFQDILIYPFSRRVVCSASANILSAAARLPLTANDVRIDLQPDASHMPDEGMPSEPIDAFIWKLALWASRGRLPAGTDLDSLAFVRRWPNLTRLLVPPNSPRVLGLWSRRPYSLKNTPSVLGLPQRYVFALYSACASLELVDITHRAADRLVSPEPPPANEKRGLFRMLLNKIAKLRIDEESQP